MRVTLIATVGLLICAEGLHAAPSIVRPFESQATWTAANTIDEHVLTRLQQRDIQPACLCSDAVFIRRVYLDVIGTLPEAADVREFLDDERIDKRARLIDALLQRDEFADYWSLKWCDLLRVKSEFPINLWPNAVQAYHHWIRDAVARNMPYDRFVWALLTSSGSNFRVPPVNFYRAVQGHEPATIAGAVALAFMGERIDGWPDDRRRGMEAFFSHVAFKATAEWKEEIVYVDPDATMPVVAFFPDGKRAVIRAGDDPRRVFADWLIDGDNPWFARNIVNRVWAWLMGRGIIHEPDDIRADNPPSNPELLAYLEAELLRADYDLRHIYRLILNSHTYQQSSIPQSDSAEAEALFAHYIVRRLDAEVLVDAINSLCGSSERYTSPIPEPFTYIPEKLRTIALADGSITSAFLELFGRPARDTGLESERDNRPTDAQRLHLLNSSYVQRKLQKSWRLRELQRAAKRDRKKLVRTLYLAVLSRYPTKEEMDIALTYLRSAGLNRRQALNDLAWALINTKEFLFRH